MNHLEERVPPPQKNEQEIKLKKKKIKDLHYLGALLSRTKGDFNHHYPHPDAITNGNGIPEDDKDDEDELETYIAACLAHLPEDIDALDSE